MVWARIGAWSHPTDLDMRMVALSVFFMAGIWGGYTHFRGIPRESWRP
jgi:hypothetical protein